jgi:hypothetical protein
VNLSISLSLSLCTLSVCVWGGVVFIRTTTTTKVLPQIGRARTCGRCSSVPGCTENERPHTGVGWIVVLSTMPVHSDEEFQTVPNTPVLLIDSFPLSLGVGSLSTLFFFLEHHTHTHPGPRMDQPPPVARRRTPYLPQNVVLKECRSEHTPTTVESYILESGEHTHTHSECAQNNSEEVWEPLRTCSEPAQHHSQHSTMDPEPVRNLFGTTHSAQNHSEPARNLLRTTHSAHNGPQNLLRMRSEPVVGRKRPSQREPRRTPPGIWTSKYHTLRPGGGKHFRVRSECS